MFDGEDDGKKNKRRNDDGEGEGGGAGTGGPDKPKGVDFKSSRVLIMIILVGIALAIFAGSRTLRPPESVPWSEFVARVSEGKFSAVRFEGREVFGTPKEGDPKAKESHAVAPYPITDSEFRKLSEAAMAKGVQVKFEQESLWAGLLVGMLPWMLILFIIYFFVFRQLRGPGGPGGVLSFGKSRATLISKEKIKKTFKDVAGIEEAKQEVEEIVGFLKNPKKFQRLGGRIPRGVLLIGGPGTGKTLLAKSIAGEADVPFFSISGSDFVEMFVGVGASRVRDLFGQARESSPCIIFLDEIDAVGRRRGTGIGGGHDEREQTLNEILVQMDGMESDEKIIVMAATNRPDVLDPALLRPGRFDRHVYVDLPDVKGREEILRVHARKVKMAPEVDLLRLAKSTVGCSGADLENIINEAALIAVMKDKDGIEMADLEEARDKVSWGREKKSRVMDEAERWSTAYHETGHAVLGYLLPGSHKPSKVTIIPRGRSLGATMYSPDKDIYNMGKKQLIAQITMSFGGRIAEQMFTGEINTGATNDIQQATRIAQRMVCEWGMSPTLGPIKYKEQDEDVFLGREMANQYVHSPSTAEMIDKEVRSIIDECYKDAERILETKREEIERVAKALMEYETISGEELATLITTGKLEKKIVKSVEHRPLLKVQSKPTPPAPDMGGATPQPA